MSIIVLSAIGGIGTLSLVRGLIIDNWCRLWLCHRNDLWNLDGLLRDGALEDEVRIWTAEDMTSQERWSDQVCVSDSDPIIMVR